MGSAVIAFSGGVDSSFLLTVSAGVLGENVIAVTARSAIRAEEDLRAARMIARKLKVKHIILDTDELKDKHIKNNEIKRCYYCKKNIFGKLKRIAKKYKMREVCDGSHAGDKEQYRPGSKAGEELGIRSPLAEAGLERKDIMELSKMMNIPGWDAPSRSCYLTRFPYGQQVDKHEIGRVRKVEKCLGRIFGGQVRSRVYDKMLRIEMPPVEFKKVLNEKIRKKIICKCRSLGYYHVTMDLEGYRTGSMDHWIR